MKRILNLLLLVTLSLFVLSACSDDSTDTDASARDDSSSSAWGSGLTVGGSANTNTSTDTETEDESTDVEGENTETEGEGGNTEDEGTDTEEEVVDSETDTDTEEEVVETESEIDEDSNTEDEGNTDTEEEAEVVNNTFTVTNLNIVYNGTTISLANGLDDIYYYSNNNLALSYSNGRLQIVGKLEIFNSAMTEKSNLALNKLRYRYFNDSISVSSIDSLYTDNGNGTYTFVYPFVLSGDDMIAYSANSSNKITFTLNNKTSFPSDEESFVSRARSIIPLQLYVDPYSIQGTYADATCTGHNYYPKMDAGATYVEQTITVKNVYAKLDDNGNLDFTFTVSGYTNGENINHNGDYAFSIGVDDWWGNSSFDGSYANYVYNYWNWDKSYYDDTITISESNSSNAITLDVKRQAYTLLNDKTAFTCDFTKISDDVE